MPQAGDVPDPRCFSPGGWSHSEASHTSTHSTDWGCFPAAGFDLHRGRTFVLMLQGVWLVRERALPENFLFLLLVYATSVHTCPETTAALITLIIENICFDHSYSVMIQLLTALCDHDNPCRILEQLSVLLSVRSSVLWGLRGLGYWESFLTKYPVSDTDGSLSAAGHVSVPGWGHATSSFTLRTVGIHKPCQETARKGLPGGRKSVTPLESWKVSTLPPPAPKH